MTRFLPWWATRCGGGRVWLGVGAFAAVMGLAGSGRAQVVLPWVEDFEGADALTSLGGVSAIPGAAEFSFEPGGATFAVGGSRQHDREREQLHAFS